MMFPLILILLLGKELKTLLVERLNNGNVQWWMLDAQARIDTPIYRIYYTLSFFFCTKSQHTSIRFHLPNLTFICLNELQ